MNEQVTDTDENEIFPKKDFQHKSFLVRLDEYGGKIEVADFDWGDPVGREIL